MKDHKALLGEELLYPSHKDFILDHYPLYNLNRASATYIEKMALELKKYSMDQPSWRVLMLLDDKNPSSVGEISRRSVTKISTITRILMRMEKEQLVKRVPFIDDKRVIEVFILKKGQDMLVKLRKLADGVFQNAMAGLSDDEIISFTNILKKVRKNLSE
jgi:MarR family transcriptional regulator, organic hydroperoxide resistance regulator